MTLKNVPKTALQTVLYSAEASGISGMELWNRMMDRNTGME